MLCVALKVLGTCPGHSDLRSHVQGGGGDEGGRFAVYARGGGGGGFPPPPPPPFPDYFCRGKIKIARSMRPPYLRLRGFKKIAPKDIS